MPHSSNPRRTMSFTTKVEGVKHYIEDHGTNDKPWFVAVAEVVDDSGESVQRVIMEGDKFLPLMTGFLQSIEVGIDLAVMPTKQELRGAMEELRKQQNEREQESLETAQNRYTEPDNLIL